MEPGIASGAPPAGQAILGQASVCRLARDHRVWEVQLPREAAPHIVESWPSPEGGTAFYCTCQDEGYEPGTKEAHGPQPPGCDHVRAVQAALQEQRDQATARRAHGLAYAGTRVEVRPSLVPEYWCIQTSVFVWEGNSVQGLEPAPSLEIRQHAHGFEWGYEGSGPAQLALAILLDYTGDAELAFAHHHAFKSQVIARLPRECGHWKLPAARIEAFLQERNVTLLGQPLPDPPLPEAS